MVTVRALKNPSIRKPPDEQNMSKKIAGLEAETDLARS